MDKSEQKIVIILVLSSAFLFLTGLGAMPLTDPDETFYAETAREMLNRNEFLTPYIFGKSQFEKPPLYYWLVIFSFKVFGVNEFSARAPSAVFAILGVIAVYLLGRLLINRRTAFLGAIILATCVKYIALARASVTDMVLTVFMLLVFLFFFYGYILKHGKTRCFLLSALFLGLAVLTKGPIGVFLPVVIIGIYLILAKELGRIKAIPFFRGALVFLAVSLPWYILMYRVHGKEFINVFFGFHNIIRYLEPEHALGDVFYYYFPILVGGFFPWVTFLPLSVWQTFREKEEKIVKANILLITWILVIFLFFSFSRTKLPTYIFPLYPAIALLTGRFLDIYISGDVTKSMRRLTAILSILFLFSLLAGGAGIFFVAKRKYPAATPALVITGAILILLMVFCVTMFLKKRYKASLVIFAISFIGLLFPLAFAIFPKIGEYESSKKISETLLKLAEPNEPIGVETRYRRGVAFYTNRERIPDVHSHNTIIKFLPREGRVWCVIKEKNHIQLYTNKKKAYDKPTYVVYRFGNKVIITNKIPTDGKFLQKRTKDEPY